MQNYKPSSASDRQKKIIVDVDKEFHATVLFVALATNKSIRELVLTALQDYFKTDDVKRAVDEHQAKQQQNLAKYQKVA